MEHDCPSQEFIIFVHFQKKAGLILSFTKYSSECVFGLIIYLYIFLGWLFFLVHSVTSLIHTRLGLSEKINNILVFGAISQCVE